MGLFSRKPKAPAPNPFAHRMGSSGTDGDYETDVFGESEFRATLLAIVNAHRRSDGYRRGRVPVEVQLVPTDFVRADCLAVEVPGFGRVGYVGDGQAKVWGQIIARQMRMDARVAFTCAAVILFDPARGPADSPRVRLDMHDESPEAQAAALDDAHLDW